MRASFILTLIGVRIRSRDRSGRLRSNQGGQVLVLGLIVIVALVMAGISVANIGIMVAERIHIQDTVDAAAYSQATVEARYMNLAAYINRGMIANYNAMAFNTALWSMFDAYDHGSAALVTTIYELATILTFIPILNGFATTVDGIADVLQSAFHGPMHTINSTMNDMFAQDEDTKINELIEIYNTDILSTYSGLLYAALQAGRYRVGKEVAAKMDPKLMMTTVLGLGAETVTADDLKRGVDHVIREPDDRDSPFDLLNNAFNRTMGEDTDADDHPLYLGATTEASLDKFVAGRKRSGQENLIRSFNTQNILGDVAGPINFILSAACETATLGFGDCNYNTSIRIGSLVRYGQEEKADEDRVPVIARKRMREVSFFGLDINLGWASAIVGGMQGHTSGEKKADVRNYANEVEVFDSFDLARFFQCLSAGCNLNKMNVDIAGRYFGQIPPFLVDDHWDGSYDVQPTDVPSLYPPALYKIPEYVEALVDEGREQGVPRYDWRVDVDNVGFPLYIYPRAGAEQRPNGTSGGNNENYLTGPSVAVMAVKRASDIGGLKGLGMGNEYDITAVARGQVYYLRNPLRPNEIPTSFNPHWVARLAPLDSDDTPELLKKGLPFLGSSGLPITPTH